MLQQVVDLHSPALQVGAPQMQHEQSPPVQAVPSGLLLVTHPPEPSQTAAVWHYVGAQV